MLDAYPDILNISDICSILRISRKTAYFLIQNSQISYRKIGRQYRISKESLIDYISSQQIEK